MTYPVLRMKKHEFDSFFMFLEKTSLHKEIINLNTVRGQDLFSRRTIIDKLCEDADYETVFVMYQRYLTVKLIPDQAKVYIKELKDFREACFDHGLACPKIDQLWLQISQE